MQAGRELDVLVAEKVLGIVRDPSRCERCGWPLEKTTTAGCVVDNCSMRPLPEIRGPAPYSTSIEAAWQVFCKFTSRFLWYDDATDTWHCHLDSTRRVMGDCRYHATSEDETGAEAICLAALKAVGVEVA